MLNKYLSGNILIGSRAWQCGKATSDWDIVCTMDTLHMLLEDDMLREIDAYPNGYELTTELIDRGVQGDFEAEEWDVGDHDNGGFGADMLAIVAAKMNNGVVLNLFVYPNRKKWKAYKKLVRNVREYVQECKEHGDIDRSYWVEAFVDEQYQLGIAKAPNKRTFYIEHNEVLKMLAGYNAGRVKRV